MLWFSEFLRDPTDAETPAVAAFLTATKVMAEHEDQKGSTWLSKPVPEHVSHALVHLQNFFSQDPAVPDEDHLAHALTRLAMAQVLRQKAEKENT